MSVLLIGAGPQSQKYRATSLLSDCNFPGRAQRPGVY